MSEISSLYLHRQLQTRLRQWARPPDQSYPASLADIVAAIREGSLAPDKSAIAVNIRVTIQPIEALA